MSRPASEAEDVLLTRRPLGVTGEVAGKVVDKPPRCEACQRPIGEYAARPWSLKCRHCKTETRAY